jgi:hypothetical protein
MNIILDTDTSDAPGCICKILNAENERHNILVQTDWEAPGVANTFGWDMTEVQPQNYGYYGLKCRHSHTDGTVDCPDCGVKASTFISAAIEYIDSNDGKSVEDPGYFDE